MARSGLCPLAELTVVVGLGHRSVQGFDRSFEQRSGRPHVDRHLDEVGVEGDVAAVDRVGIVIEQVGVVRGGGTRSPEQQGCSS